MQAEYAEAHPNLAANRHGAIREEIDVERTIDRLHRNRREWFCQDHILRDSVDHFLEDVGACGVKEITRRGHLVDHLSKPAPQRLSPASTNLYLTVGLRERVRSCVLRTGGIILQL